jgi:hypothetical protein
MPCDLTPTAETEMIRIFVKLLAPGIREVPCGTRLDGSYDLWLQLNPMSRVKQVIISRDELGTEGWKDTVRDAIDEINV